MSNQRYPGNNQTCLSPALTPAIFILTMLCILVLPAAAQELDHKSPPAEDRDERSHPIHPRYELSATELDFGEVNAFGLAEMSITVTNTSPGTIPLKIRLSRKCDGFDLPGGPRMHHLARNESVEIPVAFAPLAPGDFVCTLELGNQVPAIPLGGTALSLIEGVELDMEALDFGDVIVGFSNTLHLKVTNAGVEAFTLDPRLGDDAAGFAITPGQEGFSVTPGAFAYLTLDFTPADPGPAETMLYLGPGLPRLDMTGLGIEPVGACVANPGELVFGPLSPGETQSLPIRVTNLGNIPLDLAPNVDDPNFSVTRNSTVLLPGQTWVIMATFTPLSWGTFSAQIDLGTEYCEPVECSGLTTGEHDPSADNVGLFFDEGLTSNRTTTTESFEVVTVYLAMLNPSNTSGIAGWECRIGIEGDAAIVSAVLEGNALNVGVDNEYIVGIGGAPLPHAPAVLLATFELVKLRYPDDPVALELQPRFLPSLPGLMSWLSWDDVSELKPMFPVGGDAVVAMINDPGKALAKAGGADTPSATRILPNAPNPFNPRTEIRFELAKAGPARLTIYDVTGRLVKTLHDGHLGATRHTMVWQGRDDGGRPVASGVYYLRMVTDDGFWSRKMMLVK